MKELRLTQRQAAIISLYTGVPIGCPSYVHALAEELVGNYIGSYKFDDPVYVAYLKQLAKPLFLALDPHYHIA